MSSFENAEKAVAAESLIQLTNLLAVTPDTKPKVISCAYTMGGKKYDSFILGYLDGNQYLIFLIPNSTLTLSLSKLSEYALAVVITEVPEGSIIMGVSEGSATEEIPPDFITFERPGDGFVLSSEAHIAFPLGSQNEVVKLIQELLKRAEEGTLMFEDCRNPNPGHQN